MEDINAVLRGCAEGRKERKRAQSVAGAPRAAAPPAVAAAAPMVAPAHPPRAVAGGAAAAGRGPDRAPAAPLAEASLWRNRRDKARAVNHEGKYNAALRFSLCDGMGPPEDGYKNIVAPSPPPAGCILCATLNINSAPKKFGRPCVLDIMLLFALAAMQEVRCSRRKLKEIYNGPAAGGAAPRERVEVFCHSEGGSLGVAVVVWERYAVGAEVLARDFKFEAPGRGPSPTFSAPLVAHRAITVRLPALGLTVVCVHRPFRSHGDPPSLAAEKAAWVPALRAHLAALDGDLPVMVMGDLNSSPPRHPGDDDGYGTWAALSRFSDVTEGTTEHTHPSQFPNRGSRGGTRPPLSFLRIDYILLCAALRARLVPCSGRVLSVGAPWGDHVPVFKVQDRERALGMV